MTEWKMIERKTKILKGRAARTTPAVMKTKTGGRVVFPAGVATFPRANIYSDGNGRLAYHFCDSGKYTVAKATKSSRAQTVAIPASFSKHIPDGTTDCVLTREGDFHVLDLNQFMDLKVKVWAAA